MARNWLALDLRSLGLLRICIALCLLVDIFFRSFHLVAHYTSQGFLPLRNYISLPHITERHWSLFFLGDSPFLVTVLFLIYATFAIGLMLGIRPRLCGWMCWAFLLSLYHRNPNIANSGDSYLLAILFWGNFLPWSRFFACRGKSDKAEPEETYHQSMAGAFLIFQVMFLYMFAVVTRTGVEWQVDHSALYYSLHLEHFQTWIGSQVGAMDSRMLSLMTQLVSYGEFFGPLLLLIPSARARTVCVAGLVGFHAGLGTSLYIPNFALVAMLTPLGLLPSSVWECGLGGRFSGLLSRVVDWVGARLPRTLSRSESRRSARFESLYRALPIPAMALVVFCLFWRITDHTLTPPLAPVAELFGLNQRWDMFSPYPPHESNWILAKGLTQSGRLVELRTGRDYEESPQQSRNDVFLRDFRNYVFEYRLRGEASSLYLQGLVQRWDRSHPDDTVLVAELVAFQATTPSENVLPEYSREVWEVYRR